MFSTFSVTIVAVVSDLLVGTSSFNLSRKIDKKEKSKKSPQKEYWVQLKSFLKIQKSCT